MWKKASVKTIYVLSLLLNLFFTYFLIVSILKVRILISGHPRFFNQLSCGLDLVSMAGEWLTATANTNMFTYEIAPVFILMETVVMRKMREIIGPGWENGDSILAPGRKIHIFLELFFFN